MSNRVIVIGDMTVVYENEGVLMLHKKVGECFHERVLFERPDVMKCERCGIHLGHIEPHKIVNIPHWDQKYCPHTNEIYTLSGHNLCLNCGRDIFKQSHSKLNVE